MFGGGKSILASTAALALVWACSGSRPTGVEPDPSTGGDFNAIGGTSTSTGGSASGGTRASGGAPGSGGAALGGSPDSGGSGATASAGGNQQGSSEFTPIDQVTFYDGYATVVDEPLPGGVVRLDNALVTTLLTDTQLALIAPHLTLDVFIGALCDNYDRIGSVRLALTQKGASYYDPRVTPHVEVARFVTPFMDKNREPTSVPYHWDIGHIASILRSPVLRARHDFWLELSVFGVPYAANDEVAGCAGRNDVFQGTVTLTSDHSVPSVDVDTLVLLAESDSFNDYQVGASDAIGVTKKTFTFELEEDIDTALVAIIISQHGANAGGEEYVRREHFVSLDDEQLLAFRPGRTSCEPFRRYNTQPNGIYGPSARSDQDWQSFSNWCPGDVIDIRLLDWGSVTAGIHEFVIDVPDATFTGDEGNFPLSIFITGRAIQSH